MNDWYHGWSTSCNSMGKENARSKPTPARCACSLQFYEQNPRSRLRSQELQEYFLHRKNVNRWSPKTMRICYCGIRFFYENVLDARLAHPGES